MGEPISKYKFRKNQIHDCIPLIKLYSVCKQVKQAPLFCPMQSAMKFTNN